VKVLCKIVAYVNIFASIVFIVASLLGEPPKNDWDSLAAMAVGMLALIAHHLILINEKLGKRKNWTKRYM
jgi:hypothetical protein